MFCGIFLFVFLGAFLQNALCVPVESAQKSARLSKVDEIRSYMKENVDPCADFYEFSCGNWSKVHPANRYDNRNTNFYEIMNTQFENKLRRMLNRDREPEDTEIDKKVKDFYKSCITFVENITLADYMVELRGIVSEFGEMPALSATVNNTWDADKFDWLETVARIAHKYGKSIITSIAPMVDLFNNTVNTLSVGTPELPLGTSFMYLSEEAAEYRELYKTGIAGILHQLLTIREDVAKTTAAEVVDFEVALARGMADEKSSVSPLELTIKTTADAMTQKYAPILNIERLINITMGISVADPIYEYAESYQRNLVEVLRHTPMRIVANYIMFSLLGDFMFHIPYTSSQRESLCLTKTKKYFAKNLDNMIHRRYSTATTSTRRDIMIMWEELKAAFVAKLDSGELDWITPETRQKAREKLHAMTLEMNTYENENFADEFADLQINSNDFIGNLKNFMEWSGRRTRAKLNHSTISLEANDCFALSYAPVNFLSENKVKVPVMFLQPNTQWQDVYPKALKFATLGTVLAHELLHGFDDKGRYFDKSGNGVDWWDTQSTAAFNERKECFVDQYSRYSYGGKLLPRNMLQMENIADNGGLRLAYAAYLRWLKKASESGKKVKGETLPTMNFTSKQLYFLGFAQYWCSDNDPSMYATKLADVHAPESIRVIASVSNFPEFARQFGCSSETPMNATQKCKIY